MKLMDCINVASRSGYKVTYDDSYPGWIITTPKRPRVASQELGAYPTETRAWFGAARLALHDG